MQSKGGAVFAQSAKGCAVRVQGSGFLVQGSGFRVQGQRETFEKCSFLLALLNPFFMFKFKEGEIFNRRNTLSILRIAI